MRLLLSCLLGCLFLFSACSTARRTEHFYAKTLKKEIEKSPVFAQSFTGFTLLDPETGRILCDVNGGHNFTPASTTKILTLATCVGVLGDSVPGNADLGKRFYHLFSRDWRPYFFTYEVQGLAADRR